MPDYIVPQSVMDVQCSDGAGGAAGERSEPGGRGLVNACISGRLTDGGLKTWELPSREKLLLRSGGWGGSVVVGPGGFAALRWSVGPEQVSGQVGGIRGVIRGFSRASQRRCMALLMAVDWPSITAPRRFAPRGVAIALELTYPLEYPEAWEKWKAQLQAWRKRLYAAWPVVGVFWKLEPQERCAPHFHVLVVFSRPVVLSVFRGWLSRSWYDVVASGDPKHFEAGTSAQVVYGGGRRLMCYLGKYLGKAWSSEGRQTGRVWGVWGELPLEYVAAVRFNTRGAWVEFLRRLRRWGRRSRYLRCLTVNWRGFTVYGDGYDMLQLFRGLDVAFSDVV